MPGPVKRRHRGRNLIVSPLTGGQPARCFWLSLTRDTGPVLSGPVMSFMNGPPRGTTATAPMVTTRGTADMAADTGTTAAGTTQDSAATIAVTDATLTGTAGSAAAAAVPLSGRLASGTHSRTGPLRPDSLSCAIGSGPRASRWPGWLS